MTESKENTYDQIFSSNEYSKITGVDLSQVEATLKDFPSPEFSYRNLKESERDETVLAVQKKLKETGLATSGINDVSRWEKGWEEVLEAVKNKKIGMEVLRPPYFQYDTLRFGGTYIKVPDGSYEFDFYTTIRRILFRKYLESSKRIIEFGCGTGTNLLILSELFPGISLVGCDWASPCQKILKIMAMELKAKIEGIRFNMFTLEGRKNVEIDSETAVITMHAMEQLGTSFSSFLAYLLENRPEITFHIEPIFELYKPDRLFDALAVKYHEKRNYLKGYLPALKKLEAEDKIEIMEIRRLFFGSLFHEAYSLVVWKVK